MARDPRLRDRAERSKNRKELNAAIAEITHEDDERLWVELMNEAGVPCGPLYDIDQIFADPQVQHLEMLAELTIPARRRSRSPASR